MDNAESFRKRKSNIDNLFPKPSSDTEFRKIVTDHLIGEGTPVIDTGSQDIANTVVILYILENLPYKIINSGNTIWVPVRVEFIMFFIVSFILFLIYLLLS